MPRSGSRVRVPSRALAMKIAYAAVAQSVERRIGSAEVTGPIPVSSLIKRMLESFKIKIPAFFMFIYLGSSRGRLVNAVVAEAGSFDFYKSK